MKKIEYKNELTHELEDIFHYMEETMPTLFPIKELCVEHFIYAIFEYPDSDAYQALNKILLESTINELKEFYASEFSLVKEGLLHPDYNITLDRYIGEHDEDTLSSSHILMTILKDSEITKNTFTTYGVVIAEAIDTLQNCIEENNTSHANVPFKHQKKNVGRPTRDSQTILNTVKETNDVEKNLQNLNDLAATGMIEPVIGNQGIIESVFNVLCKRNKNNVIITGDSGIGKTATVKHIANLLYRGDVPKRFKNKTMVLMDFMSLVSNTAFRGAFESKFENIVKAAKKGNYIFFIDDIQAILNDKSKFGEVDIISVLDKILLEKNIGVIATCSNQGYRLYFESNPSLARRFQRIQMSQPTIDEAIEILHSAKETLEAFHNVSFSEKAIENAVKLSSRYITSAKLPDSAIDLIDETAARKVLWMKSSDGIIEYQNKLSEILKEKEEANNSDTRDFDRIDELTQDEIRIKSKLSKLEKEEILLSKPTLVDEDDIRIVIANKTNIPINQITSNDKSKLKDIAVRLKEFIVGQDDAIDAVSKVIKRQRVGIANPNKPAVLLFMGHTGTGKTYLAKKIAQEVFGDEKYLVRLDMSEYADKTSVNKLYGSAPGYLGYDQGGQLTEAIKKNKYCVLLLDEIEKANEDVHNVFLQMFDEGRLTDNMGTTVDFKNVIVIMTSNVGARELNESGNGLGFTVNKTEVTKTVLNKELKKAFKPEFLNRINKVVFFNRLTDDNLNNIVKLEIKNVGKKLEMMGFKLDDEFINSPISEEIYNEIKKDNTYGARPIMRQIEDKIEDVITDYLLENNVEQGHVFTYEELYK